MSLGGAPINLPKNLWDYGQIWLHTSSQLTAKKCWDMLVWNAALGSEAAEAAVPVPQLSTFPVSHLQGGAGTKGICWRARVERQTRHSSKRQRPLENSIHYSRDTLCRCMGRPDTVVPMYVFIVPIMYEDNKKKSVTSKLKRKCVLTLKERILNHSTWVKSRIHTVSLWATDFVFFRMSSIPSRSWQTFPLES